MLFNRKKELKIRTTALDMAKRLMMVAYGEYYGKLVTRSQYGYLFDDLIDYGLVSEGQDGMQLTKRGTKTVSKLSDQTYRTLYRS